MLLFQADRTAGYGPGAISATADAIREVRQGDPLAPVTVLVPSNYAGLALRRALGRMGGLANVGFMVPSRAAELLAATGLSAMDGPLTPVLRREAIRAALTSDPGPFAAAAAHPSTLRSLDTAFRELRLLPAASLDALAARSPRSAALVRVYSVYRERGGHHYDEVDRFREAAAQVVRAPRSADVLGHVVAYLPRGLSPEAEPLLDALAAAQRLTKVVPPPLIAMHRQGEQPRSLDADRLAGHVSIHVAADEDEEVRSALRLVTTALESGTPLHRTAVLFPQREYATRCFELFASAGIPCNGSSPGSLLESVAGRVLIALLSASARDFDRESVLGALALPLPGVEGYTPRWNGLARDARITRGDRWAPLLEEHARSLRADAASLPEERETLQAMLERDAALCDSLAEAVAALESLAAVGSLDTWGGFTSWAAGVLDGVAPRLHSDAARDQLDEVRSAIAELAALDLMGTPVTAAVFLESLVGALSGQRHRVRRFEEGVFIGSLDEAYGVPFDLSIVLGLAEGSLPVPPPEDPLLPPGDRGAIRELAAARRLQWVRQRQAFESALFGSATVVLSFPRASLAAQRANVPSPWLLEVATALQDGPVHGRQFADLMEPSIRPPWLEVTPSFAAGVTRRGAHASEAEWRMAALTAASPATPEHPIAAADRVLAPALASLRARASWAFTEYDGFVGPQPGLSITRGAPQSPTRLEAWSECGYRYFLASVLRVTENEDPEEPDSIDARDRGSFVHAILADFYSKHAHDRSPSDPWNDDDLRALDEVIATHVAAATASGHLGRAIPWRVELERLRAGLRDMLTIDSAWRAKHGLTFTAAEFGFGRGAHAGRPDDASAEPLLVDTPSGQVAFRGEIDRIDLAADGSVVVYDYKTGQPIKRFREHPFDDGVRLQLPVYALAAREIHGATKASASYWHLLHDVGPDHRFLPFSEDRESEFRRLLGDIAGGIESGVFPARKSRPGEDDVCRYCRFDLVCAADRARAFARKQGDHAMAPYFNRGEAPGE